MANKYVTINGQGNMVEISSEAWLKENKEVFERTENQLIKSLFDEDPNLKSSIDFQEFLNKNLSNEGSITTTTSLLDDLLSDGVPNIHFNAMYEQEIEVFGEKFMFPGTLGEYFVNATILGSSHSLWEDNHLIKSATEVNDPTDAFLKEGGLNTLFNNIETKLTPVDELADLHQDYSIVVDDFYYFVELFSNQINKTQSKFNMSTYVTYNSHSTSIPKTLLQSMQVSSKKMIRDAANDNRHSNIYSFTVFLFPKGLPGDTFRRYLPPLASIVTSNKGTSLMLPSRFKDKDLFDPLFKMFKEGFDSVHNEYRLKKIFSN